MFLNAEPSSATGQFVDGSSMQAQSTLEAVQAAMRGEEILPDLGLDETSSYQEPEILPIDGSEPEVLAQPEEAPQQEAKPQTPPPAGPKSFVVETPEGKKVKVKIDVNDEAKMAGVLQKAMKLPAMEQEIESLRVRAAAASEMETELAQLQSLAEEGGVRAVVDFLFEKEGYFEELMENERQRRNLLDSADDRERAEAKRLGDLDTRERRLQIQERKAKEAEERSKQQLSQAEQDKAQAMFLNAWSKHNLEGKLGDAELEENLNEAAFAAINREVQERTSKGQRPTQADLHAIVERRFSIIKRGYQGAADKQATQDTQGAKAAAAGAIESRVAASAPGGQSSPMASAAQTYREGRGSVLDLVKASLGIR